MRLGQSGGGQSGYSEICWLNTTMIHDTERRLVIPFPCVLVPMYVVWNPQGQMARIAQLYFPLVPIVLGHVNRLCSGHAPYISPMLGAASVHPPLEVKGDVCHTDSLPRSLPGSEHPTHSQYTHTPHTNTFRSPINSGEGGGACCHDEYEEPHKP